MPFADSSRRVAVVSFAASLLAVSLLVGCSSDRKALDHSGLAKQAKEDLTYLADDAREGRGPGTKGQLDAAAYIEKRFVDLGLKPLEQVPDYENEFTAPGKTVVGPEARLQNIGRGKVGSGTPDVFKLDTDYRPLPWGKNESFEGKAAFVGYGIKSRAYDYDDFAGIDLTGRVAICFRYAPHTIDGKSKLNKSDSFPSEAALALKARQAKNAGAVALLVVIPPQFHVDDGKLIPFGGTGGMGRGGGESLPVMSVTREVAEKIIEQSLSELQTKIDTTGKPASFLVDQVVSGKSDVVNKPYDLKNVVAVLPGVGPTADEYVVVGAHYDHVGRGEFGSRFGGSNKIHNGADDNGSGTTVLLAVARQLAAQGPQKRSVIFVAFSGEEMGLLGSAAFVKKPPVPLEKIAYMLNLDMVGRLRNDMLYLGGTQTSASMQKVAEDAAAGTKLKLKTIGRGGFGPSDHQSFAEKKIPVLFFFTGLHPQYHGPDDDVELINFDGLATIAEVATRVAVALCDLPRETYNPAYDDEGIDLAATEEQTSPPTTRPTRRRGPTSRDSIRAGDPNFPSTAPTGSATNPTTGPTTTEAAVIEPTTGPSPLIRSGRGGPRASLGVVPDFGTDQATDGVKILGTVPGSAAEKAGLKPGDVLIRLGDRKLDNLHDLNGALLDSKPGTDVEIRYNRDGKAEKVTLKLTTRFGPQ